METKFASGQLKSLKLPLQPITQTSTFANPLIHNVLIYFKTLATYTVKFLKCAWPFFNVMH